MLGKNFFRTFTFVIMVAILLSACSIRLPPPPAPTESPLPGWPSCPGLIQSGKADIFELGKNFCPGGTIGFGNGDLFEFSPNVVFTPTVKMEMNHANGSFAWFNYTEAVQIGHPIVANVLGKNYVPAYVIATDEVTEKIGLFIPESGMSGVSHKFAVSEPHGVVNPVVTMAYGGKVGLLHYFAINSCRAIRMANGKSGEIVMHGTDGLKNAAFNHYVSNLGDAVWAVDKDRTTRELVGYLVAVRNGEAVVMWTHNDLLDCGG